MAKRRVGKYPFLFRQIAVGRMKDCPSVSALAKELGIDRSNMYQWQRQLEHAGESSAREIYANKYRDLEDLHSHLEEFIDGYYNQKRLHSALGYQTPEEFEAQTHGKTEAELYSATLWFFTPDRQAGARC